MLWRVLKLKLALLRVHAACSKWVVFFHLLAFYQDQECTSRWECFTKVKAMSSMMSLEWNTEGPKTEGDQKQMETTEAGNTFGKTGSSSKPRRRGQKLGIAVRREVAGAGGRWHLPRHLDMLEAGGHWVAECRWHNWHNCALGWHVVATIVQYF